MDKKTITAITGMIVAITMLIVQMRAAKNDITELWKYGKWNETQVHEIRGEAHVPATAPAFETINK